MKFAEHLSAADIQKFNQLRKAERNKKEHKPISNPTTKKKKQENLSYRDLQELMGVHQDIYTRKNGALRRK